MKIKWPILVLLILLISGCSRTTPSGSIKGENVGGIEWSFALQEALSLGEKENKPIMLFFYSDNCGWCQVMNRTTYANQEVIELSKKFIPIIIDCDRDRRTPTKYGIYGLPAILFIDSEGNVIHSVSGYRGARDFILEMEKALEKFGRL